MTTREDTTLLDADELLDVLREHEGPPEPRANGALRLESRRKRPHVRRAAVLGAAVAAALLLGSGFGFGLGTWLTPSGGASRNLAGLGFLPERGWTVVQRAGANPGTTTAVASRAGIVVSVTSNPRGDPAEDVRYPVRELPLRVTDAQPSKSEPDRLELRAGIGGYNIAARVSFSTAPTPSALAATQRQLDRLVVAAQRVTIAVRPTISSLSVPYVRVFGTIDSGRAGESVTIQAKECMNTFFRVYAGASTEEGGTWWQGIYPSISMKLRAVWNNETSAEVTFRQRVYVRLRQRGATRFELVVSGSQTRFYGKPANIQQFDVRLGRWQVVKRVRLGNDYATNFTLRVPKGTRLRAAFASTQAKPCYVGATSSVIRA